MMVFLGGTFKNRRKLVLASILSILFITACNKQDEQAIQNDDEITFIRITQVNKNGEKQSGKIMKIIHK